MKFFTRKEAAAYLKVSQSWLAQRAQKGMEPRFARFAGGKVRYMQDDLDAFVKAAVVEVKVNKPAAKAVAVTKAPEFELSPETLANLYREGKLKIVG